MQIIKSALRFDLRKCKFTKFPGGHAPDPLDLAYFCQLCALHNMGMHFIILNLNPPTSENVPTPLLVTNKDSSIYHSLGKIQRWKFSCEKILC